MTESSSGCQLEEGNVYCFVSYGKKYIGELTFVEEKGIFDKKLEALHFITVSDKIPRLVRIKEKGIDYMYHMEEYPKYYFSNMRGKR